MQPLNIFSLVVMLVILLPDASGASVDTLPGKKRLSTIWYDNGAKIKGHIFEVTDSSIVMIKRKNRNSPFNHQHLIPVEQIKMIERKQNGNLSAVANMGLGLLVGSVIGFSMGLSDCEDPNDECGFFSRLFETNDFKAAWILSITVGGAGLIAGIFSNKKRKKKFSISGTRSNLQQHKMDLIYY